MDSWSSSSSLNKLKNAMDFGNCVELRVVLDYVAVTRETASIAVQEAGDHSRESTTSGGGDDIVLVDVISTSVVCKIVDECVRNRHINAVPNLYISLLKQIFDDF